MFNKKYWGLLILLLIICLIPHVGAADDLGNSTCDECEVNEAITSCDDEGIVEDSTDEPGTFTELDELVYNYYYVELEKDYAYNPDKDDQQLKQGVILGHDIVLDGKGHTIYGNGARIFCTLPVGGIEIYNLNFENIYTPEYLESEDVTAYYNGGAFINTGGVYMKNCTFINNFAIESGGAIINGDNSSLVVENCTFIHNGAGDTTDGGGAIMSSGNLYVVTSNFYNCSANYGGAIASMYDAYIWYCHFENNHATVNGGAICQYKADQATSSEGEIYHIKYSAADIYNCSFSNNSAAFGGAIYNGVATECYFYDNNRATTKKGHNMNQGVNIDCIDAYENPQNYWNVSNAKSFSFKPLNLVFDERNDDKLEFNVTSNPNGESVVGIGIVIRIEGDDGFYGDYTIFSDNRGIATLPLSDLSNGTYKLNVFFSNKNFNASTINYTLALGKIDSKITFSANVVFEYNSVGSIYVKVEGGTLKRENIKVLNHPEAKIDLNGEVVSISGLAVGSYTLSVETTPDENHLANTGTIGITVKKAVAVIKASKLTVALKKGTYWSIKLVDAKTNAPISNMKLTLKVFTGKKYKIFTVFTNAKGEAKYKTSKLTKGTHKVVVSGSHQGYSFNTVTSSIKVIKPKALKFKLHKRVNDKDGSLISYVVKDKKTKKGVNGIKINLLIYTGKKFKTVTLKTKKKGKFNGAMGFATNDLSVGKHKVVIVPASIKYSGSAKTSMIIKKAAKKRQSYSQKL